MSENTQIAIELASQAASASAGAKLGAGIGGTGISLWGASTWFFTSEFGVFSGFVLALVGVFINWFYRRKEYRLRAQEMELKQAESKRKSREEQRRDELHKAQLIALQRRTFMLDERGHEDS